jgi:transposase
VVLYDLTSTYFEGRHCPLAKLGHSRDERNGNPQIVIGLMTNAEGCPVAVEVFEGNTADPATVAKQVEKLRNRFGLEHIILVGDRGTLTSARIREDLSTQEQLRWITALRSPQVMALAKSETLQLSLFDTRDMVELQDPQYPGERLIACRNPLLAEERSRKRDELLRAAKQDCSRSWHEPNARNGRCEEKTGLHWRWAKRWAGTKWASTSSGKSAKTVSPFSAIRTASIAKPHSMAST